MSLDATDKPILFLLDREFEDGRFPASASSAGTACCWKVRCRASRPGRAAGRAPHRFRTAAPEVIAEIGEQDQSLPKLVLPQGVRDLASGVHQDRQYISGAEPILAALNGLLGIPVAHP